MRHIRLPLDNMAPYEHLAQTVTVKGKNYERRIGRRIFIEM